MNGLRIIPVLAILLVLAMPAAAEARAPGDVPWGEPICGFDGVCVTPTSELGADESMWIFKWGTSAPVRFTGGWQVSYRFEHYHAHRRDVPFEAVSQLTDVFDDGTFKPAYLPLVEHHPEANSPDCGQVSYRGGTPGIEDAGPGVADNGPMRHTCFPAIFDEGGYPIKAPAPQVTPPATSEPTKAAACAPIAVGKLRIAVTAAGLQCSGARNVLARYVRTGAASGWKCTRQASANTQSATCSRDGTQAVGRWKRAATKPVVQAVSVHWTSRTEPDTGNYISVAHVSYRICADAGDLQIGIYEGNGDIGTWGIKHADGCHAYSHAFDEGDDAGGAGWYSLDLWFTDARGSKSNTKRFKVFVNDA